MGGLLNEGKEARPSETIVQFGLFVPARDHDRRSSVNFPEVLIGLNSIHLLHREIQDDAHDLVTMAFEDGDSPTTIHGGHYVESHFA